MKRRALLTSALAVAACSGDSSVKLPITLTSVPPPAPPPAAVWTVPGISLNPGQTFDLAGTLPPNIKRGGAFSVSPTGRPLPSGTTLSPAGVLTAGAAGIAAGVVFGYTEP